VPFGLERVSFIESLVDMLDIVPPHEVEFVPLLPSTENTLKNPVLLTAGSPFTVVNSIVWSSEKNVVETVFVGPTGGSLCLRSNGLSASIAPMPVLASKLAQEIPALEPVVPTQTSEFFMDAAIVLGNVPGNAAGFPIRLSIKGSSGEMANIEIVLDPAFTAKMFYLSLENDNTLTPKDVPFQRLSRLIVIPRNQALRAVPLRLVNLHRIHQSP